MTCSRNEKMNEQGDSGNNLLSLNVPGIYYVVNLSQNFSRHYSTHLVSNSYHQLRDYEEELLEKYND